MDSYSQTHWYCLLLCPCPMLGPHHPAPGLVPPNWLTDHSVCQRKSVLYFLSVLLLSLWQMLLGSSYPFTRKSSMKTHFTPDQGQSPLYDIQYFSQSDPKPLPKTNPQQVSKTLLLHPGWKFSFPMCIVLSALLSLPLSLAEPIFPQDRTVSEGGSGAEPCYQIPTIYYL